MNILDMNDISVFLILKIRACLLIGPYMLYDMLYCYVYMS